MTDTNTIEPSREVTSEVFKLLEHLVLQAKKDRESFDLTVAINEDGTQWNYQTGDNSFTGGAYGLPHWAVVYVDYEDSTATDLCEDITRQWNELLGDDAAWYPSTTKGTLPS